MTTSDSQPKGPLNGGWHSALEVVSKTAAAVVIATYAAGFLVISIHQASFGFLEFNPLKPKVIAAGAWFCFLTVLPVIGASSVFKRVSAPETAHQFARFSLATLSFYLACLAPMSLTFLLFDFDNSPIVWNWLQWTSLVINIGLLLVAFSTVKIGWKQYSQKPKRIVFLSAISLGWLILQNFTTNGFTTGKLALWVFGIGILGTLILNVVRSLTPGIDWLHYSILALCIFPAFSTLIYPNIKASWGGGGAVPVQIYFSKDSRFLPGRQTPAALLDQSETGYFFKRPYQDKAIFLPKEAISIVYFSEKPLETSALK